MKNFREIFAGQFRWTLMTLLMFFVLFICLFALAGCNSDDDEPMPSYVALLGELKTDANGKAILFRDDDGKERPIATETAPLVPDSLYRVMVLTLDDGGEGAMQLFDLQGVVSPLPRKYEDKEIRRDILGVVTSWSSGRYINQRLSVRCGNQKAHTIGFNDLGVKEGVNGAKIQCMELIHNNNGDPGYYDTEVIVSCPIYQFNQLRHGSDSVRLYVNTYNGRQAYSYLY